MTEKEAIDRLLVAQKDWDWESSHTEADAVLCQFLRSLGYEQLVDEYEKVEKWFA